jgi:DNA-binding beta-propeller fold protein YncE
MPRNICSLKCSLAVTLCALVSIPAQADRFLYWTDKDAPRIHRMNADGGGPLETLLTSSAGIADPRGIVLDPAAGKFYFADAITQSIRRANLDGTDVENVVTTGQSQPADMAIDLAAGRLYWSDTAAGAIRRSDLSGNNVTTLRSGLFEP